MRTNKEPYRSKTVPASTFWRNNVTKEVAYIWATWKDIGRTINYVGTVEFFLHYDDGVAPELHYLTVNEFINQYTYVGDSLESLT